MQSQTMTTMSNLILKIMSNLKPQDLIVGKNVNATIINENNDVTIVEGVKVTSVEDFYSRYFVYISNGPFSYGLPFSACEVERFLCGQTSKLTYSFYSDAWNGFVNIIIKQD